MPQFYDPSATLPSNTPETSSLDPFAAVDASKAAVGKASSLSDKKAEKLGTARNSSWGIEQYADTSKTSTILPSGIRESNANKLWNTADATRKQEDFATAYTEQRLVKKEGRTYFADSGEEFTGDTSFLYAYGTKGEGNGVKWGVARGDLPSADYRYQPGRANREDLLNPNAKDYGWASGERGVDTSKPLLFGEDGSSGVLFPSTVADRLETSMHGNEEAMKARMVRDTSDSALAKAYGSGKSEYYTDIPAMFGDSRATPSAPNSRLPALPPIEESFGGKQAQIARFDRIEAELLHARNLKEAEEGGLLFRAGNTVASLGATLVETAVLNTVDWIGEAVGLGGIGTEEEKAAMANRWTGRNPEAYADELEEAKDLGGQIYDAFAASEQDVPWGKVGELVKIGITTPELLGDSIGFVLALWGPKGWATASGKALSVAEDAAESLYKAGKLSKEAADASKGAAKTKFKADSTLASRITDFTADNAALLNVSAGMTSNDIDTYTELHGEVPSAAKVATMMATNVVSNGLEKLVTIDTAKAFGLVGDLKNVSAKIPAEGKRAMAMKVAARSGTLVASMGKEAAQEYVQTMAEILNVEFNFDKEGTATLGDILTSGDTISAGITAAGLGAGGAVQFAGAGALKTGAAQAVGGARDKVLDYGATKLEEWRQGSGRFPDEMPVPEDLQPSADIYPSEDMGVPEEMFDPEGMYAPEEMEIPEELMAEDDLTDLVDLARYHALTSTVAAEDSTLTANERRAATTLAEQTRKGQAVAPLAASKERLAVLRAAKASGLLGSDEETTAALTTFTRSVELAAGEGELTPEMLADAQEQLAFLQEEHPEAAAQLEEAVQKGEDTFTLKSMETVGGEVTTGPRGVLTYESTGKLAISKGDEKTASKQVGKIRNFLYAQEGKLEAMTSLEAEATKKVLDTAEGLVRAVMGDDADTASPKFKKYMIGALHQLKRGYEKDVNNPVRVSTAYGKEKATFYLNLGSVAEKVKAGLGGNSQGLDFSHVGGYGVITQVEKEIALLTRVHDNLAGEVNAAFPASAPHGTYDTADVDPSYPGALVPTVVDPSAPRPFSVPSPVQGSATPASPVVPTNVSANVPTNVSASVPAATSKPTAEGMAASIQGKVVLSAAEVEQLTLEQLGLDLDTYGMEQFVEDSGVLSHDESPVEAPSPKKSKPVASKTVAPASDAMSEEDMEQFVEYDDEEDMEQFAEDMEQFVEYDDEEDMEQFAEDMEQFVEYDDEEDMEQFAEYDDEAGQDGLPVQHEYDKEGKRILPGEPTGAPRSLEQLARSSMSQAEKAQVQAGDKGEAKLRAEQRQLDTLKGTQEYGWQQLEAIRTNPKKSIATEDRKAAIAGNLNTRKLAIQAAKRRIRDLKTKTGASSTPSGKHLASWTAYLHTPAGEKTSQSVLVRGMPKIDVGTAYAITKKTRLNSYEGFEDQLKDADSTVSMVRDALKPVLAPFVQKVYSEKQGANILTAPSFRHNPANLFLYDVSSTGGEVKFNATTLAAIHAGALSAITKNFSDLATPMAFEDLLHAFPYLADADPSEVVAFYAEVKDGGMTALNLSRNIGIEIARHLGIGTGANGTIATSDAIESSLGLLGMELLFQMGYINDPRAQSSRIAPVSDGQGNPYAAGFVWLQATDKLITGYLGEVDEQGQRSIGTLKVAMKKSELLYSEDVESDYGFLLSPRPTASQGSHKGVKYSESTQEHLDALNKHKTTAYHGNDGLKVLQELFPTAQDLEAHYAEDDGDAAYFDAVTRREAQTQGRAAAIEGLYQYIAQDTPTVFFDWFVGRDHRFHLQSKGLQPQTDSKGARWLVTPESTKEEIDAPSLVTYLNSNETTEEKDIPLAMFTYGAVQAFEGALPGHLNYAGTDKHPETKVKEVMKYLVGLKDAELLTMAKQADHIGHAVLGVANLRKLEAAVAAGSTFTSDMLYEADGKTNGSAFVFMQFMTKAAEKLRDRTGVAGKDSPLFGAAGIGEMYDRGVEDVYEYTGAEVRKRMDEVKGALGGATLTLEETFSSAPGVVDFRARSFLRNLVKNPITTFFYGAGESALTAKVATQVVEDHLLPALMRKDATGAYVISDEALDKVDASTLAMEEADAGLARPMRQLRARLETHSLYDPGSAALRNLLMDYAGARFGAPVALAVADSFSEHTEINNLVHAAFNKSMQLLTQKYEAFRVEKEYKVSEQEKTDFIIANRAIAPIIGSAATPGKTATGVEVIKESFAVEWGGPQVSTAFLPRAPLRNAQGVVVDTYTKAVSVSVASLQLKETGVKASSALIIALDGAVLADAISEVSGAMMTIHDGIVTGAGQADGIKAYNKNFIQRSLGYNALQEVQDMVDRMLADPEGNELLHSMKDLRNPSYVKGNGEPARISFMEHYSEALKDTLAVNNDRRTILAYEPLWVTQMAGMAGTGYMSGHAADTARLRESGVVDEQEQARLDKLATDYKVAVANEKARHGGGKGSFPSMKDATPAKASPAPAEVPPLSRSYAGKSKLTTTTAKAILELIHSEQLKGCK